MTKLKVLNPFILTAIFHDNNYCDDNDVMALYQFNMVKLMIK